MKRKQEKISPFLRNRLEELPAAVRRAAYQDGLDLPVCRIPVAVQHPGETGQGLCRITALPLRAAVIQDGQRLHPVHALITQSHISF